MVSMNESAFPYAYFDKQLNQTRTMYGMSLRDYFAASFVKSGHVFKIISDGNTPELVAEQAYALADAMMKERAR